MNEPILFNVNTLTYILVDAGFIVTPNHDAIRVYNNTHSIAVVDEIRAAIGEPINNTISYMVDGVCIIFPD